MAGARRRTTAEVVELHRRHWSEEMDLPVLAVVLALHRSADALTALSRTVWTRYGISAAEFDVLATLRRSATPRQLTPSDLAAAMLISSGGLTKAIQRLEARGLVLRPRSTVDQRLRPVRLSAAGRRFAERVMAELTALTVPAIRAALGDAELRQLDRLLGKLEAVISGTAPGA